MCVILSGVEVDGFGWSYADLNEILNSSKLFLFFLTLYGLFVNEHRKRQHK